MNTAFFLNLASIHGCLSYFYVEVIAHIITVKTGRRDLYKLFISFPLGICSNQRLLKYLSQMVILGLVCFETGSPVAQYGPELTMSF